MVRLTEIYCTQIGTTNGFWYVLHMAWVYLWTGFLIRTVHGLNLPNGLGFWYVLYIAWVYLWTGFLICTVHGLGLAMDWVFDTYCKWRGYIYKLSFWYVLYMAWMYLWTGFLICTVHGLGLPMDWVFDTYCRALSAGLWPTLAYTSFSCSFRIWGSLQNNVTHQTITTYT